jgi:uncharacterized protein (DUF924 family)
MAYSNDRSARTICRSFLKARYDYKVPLHYKIFALMPLRHSEDLEDQLVVIDKIEEYENYWKNNDIELSIEENDLWTRFTRASEKSYKTIKKHGKFPNRIRPERVISKFSIHP